MNVMTIPGRRRPGRLALDGRRIAGAVAVLVAAGAVLGCGSQASAGPSTGVGASPSRPAPSAVPSQSIRYATGAADLVLQARSGGGLVPPDFFLTDLPAVSIYGDGRIVRSRPAGGENAALVPVLDEMRLTPQGMARVLAAAADAGLLGPDRHYDLQGVYDAWSTSFTLTADGRTHTISAYALGIDGEASMAPAGEVADRQRLSAFFHRLLDPGAWLGGAEVGPTTTYRPVQLRVFLSAVASGESGTDVRPWPLDADPALFGQPSRNGWRCAVTGDAGASQLGLDTATPGTRWQAMGRLYRIEVRPLLPDEAGCPAEG